jgi:plastocyanin
MNNEIIFFIFGGALALSAVLVSLAGLKLKDFPGKAFPLIVLWFAILVGGSATFAVLHAKDEDKEKGPEYAKASKEIEKETSSGPFESSGSEEAEAEGGEEAGDEEAGGEESAAGEEAKATGPGGTVKLEADPTDLAFDTTELESKSGQVTIDFKNPSAIPHNVAIEKDGKELGSTQTFAEGEEAVTADLAPGTYTFLCTVPGHAEAGMEGTLVVK